VALVEKALMLMVVVFLLPERQAREVVEVEHLAERVEQVAQEKQPTVMEMRVQMVVVCLRVEEEVVAQWTARQPQEQVEQVEQVAQVMVC
jgi:hypothetical protein